MKKTDEDGPLLY